MSAKRTADPDSFVPDEKRLCPTTATVLPLPTTLLSLPTTLLSLPTDVLGVIATCLHIDVYLTMIRSCKHLRSRLRNRHVQQQVIIPAFSVCVQKDTCTWYEDRNKDMFCIQNVNLQNMRTLLSHYQDGKQHGTRETWNDQGVRTHLTHWQNGELHGTDETWNDQGVRILL